MLLIATVPTTTATKDNVTEDMMLLYSEAATRKIHTLGLLRIDTDVNNFDSFALWQQRSNLNGTIWLQTISILHDEVNNQLGPNVVRVQRLLQTRSKRKETKAKKTPAFHTISNQGMPSIAQIRKISGLNLI